MKSQARQRIEACAAFAALLAGMYLLHIPCPIRWLTGISCAGCGMTRAWVCALQLDFAMAFRSHPLWPFMVPALACFLLRERMPKWLCRVLVAAFIVLFFVVYAFRMADPLDEIVSFNPSDGAIGKMLRLVLSKHT